MTDRSALTIARLGDVCHLSECENTGCWSREYSQRERREQQFKWVGIVFGAVALATFLAAIFMSNVIFAFIGYGGTERWVAYPILRWLTGFGGCLMSATSDLKK